ncbi:MAG: endonuclease [Firmicutes bacterium]|nr:endonuclease [Bacillota bacterium]
MKRWFAALLAAVMIWSTVGLRVSAAVPEEYTNTGTRHEVALSLSEQAQIYYGRTELPEEMVSLSGSDAEDSVMAAASDLFAALHAMMRDPLTHPVSYKSLTSYWPYTDASAGSAGAVFFYADTFGGDYSREHVWPKSHGNFHESGAGSDLHHLRPTNAGENSARNNYTFGNVAGVLDTYETFEYNGETILWLNADWRGDDNYGLVEVADDVKGDVARILLYVYVTYGELSGENLNLFTRMNPFGAGDAFNDGEKVIESLDTLLEWCAMDPVDTWEMSRNDACEVIQGNRNVFIDYPEFAWMLFNREIPAMLTPSGYALRNESSFQVLGQVNDQEAGIVMGDGGRWTAIPANGYYLRGYRLEPSGAATVLERNGEFALTDLRADCTLTFEFAPKENAVLRLLGPENEELPCMTGETVILPSRPDLIRPDEAGDDREYRFVGWVTQPVADSGEWPALYPAGHAYLPANRQTALYALYAYVVEDPDGALILCRPAEELREGPYVIGVEEFGSMMGSDNTNGAFEPDQALFRGGSVINAAEENVFYLSMLGDQYIIRDSLGRVLRANATKKLEFADDVKVITQDDPEYLWDIEWQKGGPVRIRSCREGVGMLQFNSHSPRFTAYTSAQTDITLYEAVYGYEFCCTLDQTPEEESHPDEESSEEVSSVGESYASDSSSAEPGDSSAESSIRESSLRETSIAASSEEESADHTDQMLFRGLWFLLAALAAAGIAVGIWLTVKRKK